MQVGATRQRPEYRSYLHTAFKVGDQARQQLAATDSNTWLGTVVARGEEEMLHLLSAGASVVCTAWQDGKGWMNGARMLSQAVPGSSEGMVQRLHLSCMAGSSSSGVHHQRAALLLVIRLVAGVACENNFCTCHQEE